MKPALSIRQPDVREIRHFHLFCGLDGTWHRPFTKLELAALQSLVEPEEQLELDGLSDRESINSPESWAANPWVWVVEFKRVAA